MERPAARPPDTIAAIATAPGRGGIGVVRVSGSSLGEFALALTGRTPRPRIATLARFRDADGEPIDEGVLLYFPAPASFTVTPRAPRGELVLPAASVAVAVMACRPSARGLVVML